MCCLFSCSVTTRWLILQRSKLKSWCCCAYVLDRRAISARYTWQGARKNDNIGKLDHIQWQLASSMMRSCGSKSFRTDFLKNATRILITSMWSSVPKACRLYYKWPSSPQTIVQSFIAFPAFPLTLRRATLALRRATDILALRATLALFALRACAGKACSPSQEIPSLWCGVTVMPQHRPEIMIKWGANIFL